MPQLLSDQDVFGAPPQAQPQAQPRLLSDDEVFSQPQQSAGQPAPDAQQASPNGTPSPQKVLNNQQRDPVQKLSDWANSPTTVDLSDLPQSGKDLSFLQKLGAGTTAVGRGLAGAAEDNIIKPTVAGVTGLMQRAGGYRPTATEENPNPDQLNGNELSALAMMSPAMKAAIPSVESIGDNTVGNALQETAENDVPQASTGPVFTKAQSKAHDILSQALATEGIKPEDIAQRLEQAKSTGLPLTALDVATQNVGGVQTQGRNLLGLADAAANMPGEGATMAGDVAARGYGAKARIGDAFDKFISSGKPYQVTDDALQRMSTEAAPAYEKAFAQGPVYSDRIGQLLKTPEIQQGIQRGMQIQRIEAAASGKPFSLDDYAGIRPDDQGNMQIVSTPNMRSLDAGKQGLDAMIGDETNDLTGKMTQMGRALTQLKKSYVGELDNLNPDYAAARNAYGSQASRLQALRDGMGFMQMQPEEIKRYMADPNNTLADQMAYAVGVRQKLQDVTSQVGDNANAITRLWKDNVRDRLEPMFGDKDAFAQFSDLMQHEQNMARVNGVLTRGSQTMPRQQYAQAITQSPSSAGKILGMLTNPKGAAIDSGLGFLNNQMQKSAAGMTNDTAAEIMRHLTTSDPQMWYNFGQYSRATGGRIGYAKGGAIPTDAQKAAGNYKKEHITIHGLPIAIENAAGSIRSGKGSDDKEWRVRMPVPYGYIKRTEGADGDAVDVFCGPYRKSDKVFVIDQVNPKDKKYDEAKVMLGFMTPQHAVDTYKKSFSDGKGLDRIGKVTKMSIEQFKDWLKRGDTTKPMKVAA